MQDFLQESWLYQEIMQKGRDEERQQRLKDQRQLLMTIIHMHFPNIAVSRRSRRKRLKIQRSCKA